jgi:hypothetical protein
MDLLLKLANWWPAAVVALAGFLYYHNSVLRDRIAGERAISAALEESNRLNREEAEKQRTLALDAMERERNRDSEEADALTPATAIGFLRDSFGSGK